MDLLNLIPAVQVLDITSFDADPINEACKVLNQLGNGDSVVLDVNSYGGDAYNYLRLRTALDFAHSRGVVSFSYCSGVAMSAGLYIFAACMNRISGPYAQYLLHPVQSGFMGDIKAYREDLKRTEELNEKIIQMFHQDIGSDVDLESFIESIIEGQDQYLSVDDGIKMGFIDSVGAIKFETTVNVVQITNEELNSTKSLICEQRKALRQTLDSGLTEEELEAQIQEYQDEVKALKKELKEIRKA